jgi:type II secretory pathway component PulK
MADMNPYFTANSDADAIAATLLPALIPFYLAITDAGIKTAALLQASGDIDLAFKYQGRRFDPVNQLNEFPRIARDPSTVTIPNVGAFPAGTTWGQIVWDLDPTTLQPIVPGKVLQAVIYQANFISSPAGTGITDAQFAGVKLEKIGTAVREYELKNPGLDTGLCRRAWLIMRLYKIATGKMF